VVVVDEIEEEKSVVKSSDVVGGSVELDVYVAKAYI
jgi:hypothetical protein